MKLNKRLVKQVNPKLVHYVKTQLFPIYDTLDNAHNSEHIVDVIHRSFHIAKSVPTTLNYNIVFAVASFHDIGLVKGRQGHADISSEMVKSDEFLFSQFTEKEVEEIAIAVQDHSLSKNREPRSLYGKLVADADKDHNPKRSLRRMWEFSLSHFKERTWEEHIQLCYEYFYAKYGKNGRVKYYIPCKKTSKYLVKMKKMAESPKRFRRTFAKFIR